MKKPRKTEAFQNAMSSFILYVVGPVFGLILVALGMLSLPQCVEGGRFHIEKLGASAAFLLIGGGLIQFAYLLHFKPETSLSKGALYFASIGFVAIGAFILIMCLFIDPDIHSLRGAPAAIGICGIGIASFHFARARSKQNQSKDPAA